MGRDSSGVASPLTLLLRHLQELQGQQQCCPTASHPAASRLPVLHPHSQVKEQQHPAEEIQLPPWAP